MITIGSGSWDASAYTTRTTSKIDAGKDIFDYDSHVRSTGVYEVHPSLDPKAVNKDGAHEGKNIRESLDSDEHPESRAIAVLFDVTGSMGRNPRILQEKLPKLHALILQKGYVEHPQILFGAIGDATSGDRLPLQVGQFESDNRMDEQLESIVLEGGGGGGNHESYQLAAYFIARHTFIDCYEKRGQRGYLFIIGDERTYRSISRHEVENLIGDTLQEDLTTEQLFAELRQKWDVYYLFAAQGYYQPGEVVHAGAGDGQTHAWNELLGQNALILDDTSAVCETIALTIGLNEGMVDIDEGLDHLRELGTESETVDSVGKTLALVGASATPVATASGALPDDDSADGTERL